MRGPFRNLLRQLNMWLIFAIALIVLWIAARVLGFVAGAALDLLGIAAVLLLVVGAINGFRRR